MHMVIRVIVPADTKKEALSEAETIFEGLCGDGKDFDYYEMFNTPGTTVSGKGRYGHIPAALEVSSPGGQKMVEEGMQAMERDFERNLERMRACINRYTPKELFEGRQEGVQQVDLELDMFRHSCFKAGEYSGSSVWLYDYQGSSIRNRHDLENALRYTSEGGKKLWVVPADVHF